MAYDCCYAVPLSNDRFRSVQADSVYVHYFSPYGSCRKVPEKQVAVHSAAALLLLADEHGFARGNVQIHLGRIVTNMGFELFMMVWHVRFKIDKQRGVA